MSHGGPTGNATAILDLEIQFLTSRGFAVVDVNYGGSGYGRAYRERLNGQWGVVDVRDCVNAARFLVAQWGGGRRPSRDHRQQRRLHDDVRADLHGCLAAGTVYYGVADLEQFVGADTHKFESQYQHTLIGPYPDLAELYRARSPIHFVDRISTPMLVLQGADDEVVLPSHAERIVDALRERDATHVLLLFEGGMFRKTESIIRPSRRSFRSTLRSSASSRGPYPEARDRAVTG